LSWKVRTYLFLFIAIISIEFFESLFNIPVISSDTLIRVNFFFLTMLALSNIRFDIFRQTSPIVCYTNAFYITFLDAHWWVYVMIFIQYLLFFSTIYFFLFHSYPLFLFLSLLPSLSLLPLSLFTIDIIFILSYNLLKNMIELVPKLFP
jgi:hypothetical protein